MIFNTAITAEGPIDRIRTPGVTLSELQSRVHESFRIINDDLQTTKFETFRVRITDGDYVRSYREEVGYEAISMHFAKRVGIGLQTPEAKLHVLSDTGISGGITVEENGTSASTRVLLDIRRSRNIYTQKDSLVGGDILGDIVYSGHDGTSYQTIAIQRAITTAVARADDITGELRWFTRPAGLGATATLRFGVDPGGNVWIGDKVNQLAVGAVNGFFHLPSMAGGAAPAGVPTVIAGSSPCVFNPVLGILYIWNGAVWTVH